MSLLWPIVRRSLGDLWEESFLLILFNMFWVTGALPGFFLLGYGAIGSSLPVIALGLLAILPWPFVTFGLFHAAYEVGQRKAIGLSTFFSGGRQLARQAYLWGGLNVVVMAVLLANVRFYGNPASPLGDTGLGAVLGALFTSLTLLWLVLQLFVLAVYPRLERPGLRRAFRQAGILALTRPVPVLFVAALAVILALAGLILPPLGFLVNFALIALLANRATAAMRGEAEKPWEGVAGNEETGR